MTITLYETRRQPIFRDGRGGSHGVTRNNIGNVIIIIVIYAKCLERTREGETVPSWDSCPIESVIGTLSRIKYL